MHEFRVELAALARHLHYRRPAILKFWRDAIAADPALTTGTSLPRAQLNDHIPAVLAGFGRELCEAGADAPGGQAAPAAAPTRVTATAAAHGLHRWQQGYDLREVVRELGRLNECMVRELEQYASDTPAVPLPVMTIARSCWARACSRGVEESTAQYYRLQQAEAASHLQDLERALEALRELEQQRGELWRQVAHDLRGNVGVVASATHGLGRDGISETLREKFLRTLERNVGGLRELLDDVTSLARLNAGSEQRQLAQCDVGALLSDLCEGLVTTAQQQGLTLTFNGPVPFIVEADAAKTRRLAQNLVMNAIKYTSQGSVRVAWGGSERHDGLRWALSVEDTGPGLVPSDQAPLTTALVGATQLPHECSVETPEGGDDSLLAAAPPDAAQYPHAKATAAVLAAGPAKNRAHVAQPGGEGIGLSIVKRLCELLDAAVELSSTPGVGTAFHILLPRQYPDSVANPDAGAAPSAGEAGEARNVPVSFASEPDVA